MTVKLNRNDNVATALKIDIGEPQNLKSVNEIPKGHREPKKFQAKLVVVLLFKIYKMSHLII